MAAGVVTAARVGVVVPARNEEELLGPCLDAIEAACAAIDLPCDVAIVLDRCRDGSAGIARRWQRHLVSSGSRTRALVLRARAGGAGAARRLGAGTLLERSHTEPEHVWLATTDADSTVPTGWLVAQLGAHETGAQLWTGRVTVADWSGRLPGTGPRWRSEYEDEDTPVHGANLGVNGATYRLAGGFPAIACGEDRALYDAVLGLGLPTVHDRHVAVLTSARRSARAPRGFATALRRVELAVLTLPACGAIATEWVPLGETAPAAR